MAETPPVGPMLFGASRRSTAPPNTFRPWQYALIAIVLLLGGIYAAPNLFQPDPALQIRSLDVEAEFGSLQPELVRVTTALEAAGIPVVGSELAETAQGRVRVLLAVAVAAFVGSYVAAAIKARGGELDSEPTDRPWGARDFSVVDPDGFRISISSQIDES